MFCTHINTLEQFLYTDFIKQQKRAEITANDSMIVDINSIVPANDERNPVYEDIMKVYGHAMRER